MKIALYFGSFNPIHVGHLIIANHVINETDVDQLWFVVSPHNPLKESASLLNEHQRLHLVRLAIEEESSFQVSNIEFGMPRPSYTIDTLTFLEEKYTEHEFAVVMGGDSFQNITKWKNYKTLLHKYDLLVYQRPGFNIDTSLSNKIKIMDAPLLEISSTRIRKLIKEKKSFRYLVADPVLEEIEAGGYYR
jgi:nicotinate-nucleotide adenylyltransferase